MKSVMFSGTPGGSVLRGLEASRSALPSGSIFTNSLAPYQEAGACRKDGTLRMRLFIAIEIPGEIKKMMDTLRVDISGARWVPAEQIHLTLAFLGEVEESTVELLKKGLARIHQPEFTVHFSGTGCFPERRRPRVLWIGVTPDPSLNRLAGAVRETVGACGIALENRPFSPHITLARLKFPAPGESDAFFDRPDIRKLPPFPVKEFILFHSRLTQHGAIHSRIESFPLVAVNG